MKDKDRSGFHASLSLSRQDVHCAWISRRFINPWSSGIVSIPTGVATSAG
ncbi:MAG: hypothetical protein MUF37_02165 [Methanoregulaceae archaeon]|nr:hypothetical protein [Methanoregulaceae archaeon]